ncbi:MAG TPA: alanine dehydrogenase, partial [Trueperaceae bacterium]|nr:alanine dehydrogenase [Trueperaceae bacterium]
MNIGVPREIKAQEHRVAVTPGAVHALSAAGHSVVIETGAGLGSGFTDEEYASAGALVGVSASEAWSQRLVMKV